MLIHSYAPCPLSRKEIVSWIQKQLLLRSVEDTNFKNSKSQYTQEHELLQNWTPPIPYKGCSRGPKLGTYSDWGLSSVLVLNEHLSHHPECADLVQHGFQSYVYFINRFSILSHNKSIQKSCFANKKKSGKIKRFLPILLKGGLPDDVMDVY